MKQFMSVPVILACLIAGGCASQFSHDSAMQEWQEDQDPSNGDLERLQNRAGRAKAELSGLQEMNQDLEQALRAREADLLQLQETKRKLESMVEVQEQIKDQQVSAAKQELEALYEQISGTENGWEPSSRSAPLFADEPVDFEDLTIALTKIRDGVKTQVGEVSLLREQNAQLGKELADVEDRLHEVERLKAELEQVRRAREFQEAQLARVKDEVLTVGSEIERITQALENQLGQSLVVAQHHDRLVLTMLGQVLFESGEADLTPLGLNIMKQVGQVLAALPGKNIQVEGHTDTNPIHGRLQQQYPTNWELSTARATTVLRYLIEQTGMDPTYFSAAGYADTRPVMTNETEEGRAQNRRVEIVLYPDRAISDRGAVAVLNP
jgi:chemotaxis protein MotB